MIDLEDIKAIVTPKSLAKLFLGSPSYERGNALWYCSPFRDEKHPSFKVDNVGMYDFGTNTAYGIFDFVMALRHCSFGESKNILASLYGIADRDYDSKELIEWHRKQREEQARYERELHKIYLAIWDEVDAEYKLNQERLELFSTIPQSEAYAKCLHRQNTIDMLEEQLAEHIDTWQDKEKLMKKAIKGDLPKWLITRLKTHTTILQNLNIKPRLRREY